MRTIADLCMEIEMRELAKDRRLMAQGKPITDIPGEDGEERAKRIFLAEQCALADVPQRLLQRYLIYVDSVWYDREYEPKRFDRWLDD